MRNAGKSTRLMTIALALVLLASAAPARAQVLLDLDFTEPASELQWQIRHNYPEAITDWDREAGTMLIRAGYFETMPIALPDTVRWARLTVRARIGQDLLCAVYFFDDQGRQLYNDQHELLPASTEMTDYVFCFRPHADAKSIMVRIGDAKQKEPMIELADVRVEAVSDAEVLDWSNQTYARVAPVLPLPEAVRPEPGFWDRLPRTKQAIEQGKPLKVVILGDSIASDTATSSFEVLLEAAHPGLRVDVVASTRSGTGTEYYRENDRVQQYVSRHKPDLVVIMGISQQKVPEAYGDVIDQVRDQTDAEVLVMPGAVSRFSPFGSEKYDSQMERLGQIAQTARAHGAAWFNLRAAWETYCDQTGTDHQALRRDPVHASTLGRQVLARILSRVLDPSADPAAP